MSPRPGNSAVSVICLGFWLAAANSSLRYGPNRGPSATAGCGPTCCWWRGFACDRDGGDGGLVRSRCGRPVVKPRPTAPPGRVRLRVPKLIRMACGRSGSRFPRSWRTRELAGKPEPFTSNLAPTSSTVFFWSASRATAFVGDIFHHSARGERSGRLAAGLLSARRSASAATSTRTARLLPSSWECVAGPATLPRLRVAGARAPASRQRQPDSYSQS